MPHTKNSIVDAVNEADKALDKVNSIFRGAIAANENAMRGNRMVTAYFPEEPLELNEPARQSTIKDLAAKMGG